MILRLGVRLALSRSAQHRWRQISIPVCGCLATLLILFGAALLQANQRQRDRQMERMPALAEEPGSGLFLLPRGTSVGGEPYLTIWLSADPGSTVDPPPGLAKIPAPGEAVISPALANYLAGDSSLAERYPGFTLIDSAGLVSSDELLAYVGLPDNRRTERAYEISAFQRPEPGQRGALALTAGDLPSLRELATGVAVFLGVPALLLLQLGVSSASSVREHRFSVLYWLGAPAWSTALIAVVETMTLLVPGVMLALLIMRAWLQGLGSLPFVTMDPVQGDLILPWAVMLSCAVAVLSIGGAMAVVTPLAMQLTPKMKPRPGASTARLQPYRAYPLGIAVILLLSRPWLSESQSDGMLFAAILLLLVGVPLTAPLAVRQMGMMVAEIRTVPALLAGRRLTWDPVRNARPHIAAATLVALTLSVLGYQKLTNAEVRPSTPMAVAFATVDSGVVADGDLTALRQELYPALVIPFREDASRWIIGTPCSALTAHIAGLGCNPQNPNHFDNTGEQVVSRTLGLPPQLRLVLAPDLVMGEEWHEHSGETGSEPHSHAPAQGQTAHHHDGLMVLDATRSPTELEDLAGTVGNRLLPGSSVDGASRFRRFYPASWSWTVAGLAVAAAALALGTAIPIVDALVATKRQRDHLLKVGVTERRLKWVEGMLFGVPFLTVTILGLIAGLASCWLLVNQSSPAAPMPWGSIRWVALGAVVLALAGSAVVATLVGRAPPDRRD